MSDFNVGDKVKIKSCGEIGTITSNFFNTEYFYVCRNSDKYSVLLKPNEMELIDPSDKYKHLKKEHDFWAKEFGSALIAVLQDDFEAIKLLAKRVKFGFKDGSPIIEKLK